MLGYNNNVFENIVAHFLLKANDTTGTYSIFFLFREERQARIIIKQIEYPKIPEPKHCYRVVFQDSL